MFQRLKRPSLSGMRAEDWLAAGNLTSALALALAAFGLRPARTPVIELPAVALILLLAVSGAALARRSVWAVRLTRVAGAALLGAGLLAVAALALTLAFRRGVAGPGGGPSALLIAVGLLLVVPYAVVYPAGLLLWAAAKDRPR